MLQKNTQQKWGHNVSSKPNRLWFLLGVTAAILVGLLVTCLSISVYFQPKNGWEKHGHELTALATGLYWEAAVAEDMLGLWAIASVFDNRRRSKSFPDTYREVIGQGAKGKHNGGCQFSFMCDGRPETISLLCKIEARAVEIKQHWGGVGCQRRWGAYLAFTVFYQFIGRFLYDPTDGAVMYYAGMRPYWYGDLTPESVRKIGSNTFGQSRYLGRDL